MAFPLCMCSGFPMEKVDQTIMMTLSDATVIAHAIGGGKYIMKSSLSFRAVIWVSDTEPLGPLLIHWPSTLAILLSLMELEYIQDELFTLFIHVYAPRFLGNILVSMVLVV